MSYHSDQKSTRKGKSSAGRKRASSQIQQKIDANHYNDANPSRRSFVNSQRKKRQPSFEDRRDFSSRPVRNRNKQKNGCFKWLFFLILLVLLVVLLVNLVKGCSNQFRESLDPTVWSEEVVVYRPTVEEKAKQYGIEAYTDILLSIMMQESKGLGTDPMQSSECIHNTQYERVPGGIKDPDYSIDCGVQYFADALDEAGCKGLNDTNALMLAIQGYNYGHGYISWAIENYGGYSKENAEIFSDLLKEELGWSAYGDPDYVVKVLNYYYASCE